MKRALYIGAALLTATPAFAADLGGSYKDEPIYMPAIGWSGFYMGAHLGVAAGHDKVTDVDGWNFYDGRTFSFDDTAFVGGGQIGYNVQMGHIVVGVEADLGHLGLNKTYLDYGSSSGEIADVKAKTGLYGAVTGRLGVANDRWLVYAKGGLALVDAKFSYDDRKFVAEHGSISDTLTGWVLGGGVEYALSNNWSVKAEYQHFDFQNATLIADGDPFKNELTVDTVTAGINYKFGRNEAPLK
jgi:outer membrane immunogenic protein